MAEPFLAHEQIGDVPLPEVLHVLDTLLRFADRHYPEDILLEHLTSKGAERLYRGLVGARRVVLQAMQREFPLGETR